jgi:hypothetical protein
MTRQFLKEIKRKIFTLLALLIIICSGSSQLKAASGKTDNSKEEAQVVYKGVKNELLVFAIEYKNLSKENFAVEIKNDRNEIVYRQNFDAKPLSKNIYLSDVAEKCKLTFSIKSVKKQIDQSFEINHTIKTIEDYDVKEIR